MQTTHNRIQSSSPRGNHLHSPQLSAWSGQSGAANLFLVIFDGKVYANAWWVETAHCPSQAMQDPNHNPWRVARNATAAEMAALGNPTSCVPVPPPVPEPVGTALLIDDPTTKRMMEAVGYKPDGSGTNLSYTSTRVARSVYNDFFRTVEDYRTKPELSAYITDWSQYDGRLDGLTAPKDAGRGFDLALIPNGAYDRLVFSFMGIAGDHGPKATLVSDIVDGWNTQVSASVGAAEPGHIIPLDSWGDVASYRNLGLNAAQANFDTVPGNFLRYYNQEKAAGLLGGLRQMKAPAAGRNSLQLAFSVGGWTMSGPFSELAGSYTMKHHFVRSAVEMFDRFPMFDAIDIDWEYPCGGGLEGNTASPDDAANYAVLIAELRAALDLAFNPGKKKITIASAGVVDKLKQSNIAALIKAGVDRVFMMSYDYFGTGWAEKLAHHSNLRRSPASPFSLEASVEYLLASGVPPKAIHIGYANYGRSAAGANLATGLYNRTGAALGSFETGAPEFYDILRNYLDLEGNSARGKNGFTLMTDTVADADFLYNQMTHHFISLDTPRTVRAKGAFVRQHGLGGLFSWAADQDNGVLANAAREGLGYDTVSKERFPMGAVYNAGETHVLGG